MDYYYHALARPLPNDVLLVIVGMVRSADLTFLWSYPSLLSALCSVIPCAAL